MMSFDTNTAPPHDDGFRFSSDATERGIRAVEADRSHALHGPMDWRALAAAVALIVGAAVSLPSKETPCVTWACQVETLSVEEMEAMMELLNDGSEATEFALTSESWDF